MDYLDFEKNIKNTLSSSRKELDMNQLLKDLDIKPQKEVRRGFAFWGGLSLLGLLLVSGVGLYFYTNGSSNNNVAPEVTALQEANAQEQNQNEASLSMLEVDVKSKKETTQTNVSADSQESDAINSDLQVKRTDNSTVSTSKPLANKLNAKNNTLRSTTQKNTFSKNLKPTLKNSKTTILNTEVNKTQNNQATSTPAAINENPIIENSNSSKDVGLGLETASVINHANSTLSPLPLIEGQDVTLEEDGFGSFPKVKGCPTFKDRNWSWSFLPEIGYGWPIKNLRQNFEGFEDLFDARTFNEITLESFQAGGYLEMKHHSGFYFKTGFAYASITEQMNVKQRLIIRDTMQELTEVIETPDSTIYVFKDVITETEINKNNKVHYTIHSYDVPVAVGYSHLLRDFTLDFEAGVRFNILTKASGRIFNAENTFEELGDNERHFKRQVGLGVFAGLYIKKQLSEFGEVYLAPRFVFNTDTVSSAGNPIRQKYHSFGLHIGYVYTFAVKKL